MSSYSLSSSFAGRGGTKRKRDFEVDDDRGSTFRGGSFRGRIRTRGRGWARGRGRRSTGKKQSNGGLAYKKDEEATEEFEANSYSVDIIQRSPRNKSDDENRNTKQSKVKLIRNAELEWKEEDEELSKTPTAEALYLPDTVDLDQDKLHQRLLVEANLIEEITGVIPLLEVDNDQLYFLVKHNDPEKVEEVKEQVIQMVQSVITDMRGQIATAVMKDSCNSAEVSAPSASEGLVSSRDDFITFMKSGAPTSDEAVYGFITNIPRGKSGKRIHSHMVDLFRKRTGYSGPDFAFLSMFDYNDRSLNTKFIASKFPSRTVLRQCISTCSPLKAQQFTAYIYENPPPEAVILQNIKKLVKAPKRASTYSRPLITAPKHDSAEAVENDSFTGYPMTRLQGVFPDGVQPEEVVLVIDDQLPCIDVAKLKEKGFQVLTGSNLDAVGFLDLIKSDSNFDKNGILYVVQPGLDFFLKNIKACAISKQFSEVQLKDGKSNYSVNSAISALLKIVKHFSCKFEKADIDILCQLSDVDLLDIAFDELSTAKKCKTQPADNINNEGDTSGKNADGLGCITTEGHVVVPATDTLGSPRESKAAPSFLQSDLTWLFVCRLIHLSLTVQSSVTVNSLNSSLVFLGYPVEWLLAEEIQDLSQLVTTQVCKPLLSSVMHSLLAALRVFNIFCANTWRLGGFQGPNFNKYEPSCDIPPPKPCIKSRLSIIGKDNKLSTRERPTGDYLEEDCMHDILEGIIADTESLNDMEVSIEDDEDHSFKHCGKTAKTEKSSKSFEKENSVTDTTNDKQKSDAVDVYESDNENEDLVASASPAGKKISNEQIFLLSQLKKFFVIKKDTTNDVLKAVIQIIDHYKTEGSFVPWTSIRGTPFPVNSVPDVVAEYLGTKFFKEQFDSRKKEVVYQCKVACGGQQLGDIVATEAHPYTRVHVEKVLLLSKNTRVKHYIKTQANYLANTVIVNRGLPIAEDLIEKLEQCRLVERQMRRGSMHYKCLVCPGAKPISGVLLRMHLQSYKHRNTYLKTLGLRGPYGSPAFEHWRILKRMLRYDGMDVVVVADDIHQPLLHYFSELYKRVHVITIPDLLRSSKSKRAAVNRWLEYTTKDKQASRCQPPPSLWIIVTGLDLLVSPLCLSTSSTAVTADASSNSKQCVDTQSENDYDEITMKDDPEQELFDYGDLDDLDVANNTEVKPDEQQVKDGKGHDALALNESGLCSSDVDKSINWATLTKNAPELMKKLLSNLIDLHAFLRVRLPSTSKILVSPALPLSILSSSLLLEDKDTFMMHRQAITVRAEDAPAVAEMYKLLAEKVYSVHVATSHQENVFKVEREVLKEDVKVLEEVQEQQCVLTSPWHVALEDITVSALFGMPSVHPNFSGTKNLHIRDVELSTKLFQSAIVGDAARMIAPDSPATLFKRSLNFDEADIEWIVTKAKEQDNSKFTVWYLGCPFPQILFSPTVCSTCTKQSCSAPLKVWAPVYDVLPDKVGNDALRRVAISALNKVSAFVTQLQTELPEGNFVTLFPIFPTSVISYDTIENSIHKKMHNLFNEFPSIYFSPQPCEQVLLPIIDRFKSGWLELFHKIRFGHSENFTFPNFKQINIHHIATARRKLSNSLGRNVHAWLEVVNSILKDHLFRTRVNLSDRNEKLVQGAFKTAKELQMVSMESDAPATMLEESFGQQDCRALLDANRTRRSSSSVGRLSQSSEYGSIEHHTRKRWEEGLRSAHSPSPSRDRRPPLLSVPTTLGGRNPLLSISPLMRPRSPLLQIGTSLMRPRSPLLRSRSPIMQSRSFHGRQRSPRTREGSPIMRGRSPIMRGRSPAMRERSPIMRGRSPVMRGRSPVMRGRSPVMRGRSPVMRGRSPVTRGKSPIMRGRSPIMRGSSPIMRGRSPIMRRRSPIMRGRSPIMRGRSPFMRGGSPISREGSAILTGRSPLKRERSPFMGDTGPNLRGRNPMARESSPRMRERSPQMRERSPIVRGNSSMTRRRSPNIRGKSPVMRMRSPVMDDEAHSVRKRPLLKAEGGLMKRSTGAGPSRSPCMRPDDFQERQSLRSKTSPPQRENSRMLGRSHATGGGPECHSVADDGEAEWYNDEPYFFESPNGRYSKGRAQRMPFEEASQSAKQFRSTDRREMQMQDRRKTLERHPYELEFGGDSCDVRSSEISMGHSDMSAAVTPDQWVSEAPNFQVSRGTARPTEQPQPGQFVFTVSTAGREQLSQHWANKLAWVFKLDQQPTLGQKGTWRLQTSSARVAFSVQRFLPAVRLVDLQLIVTLCTVSTAVVPTISVVEEDHYRQRLEFVSRCYNEDRAPRLVGTLLKATTTNFFRSSWQHVYIRDLSRTIPCVADALRSLAQLPPAQTTPTVRLVVVTPSPNTVRVIMKVLHPVAHALGMSILAVLTGTENAPPGVSAVVGAAPNLLQCCPRLYLQDVAAIVLDDAAAFLEDHMLGEALGLLLGGIAGRCRDWVAVNRVAVVREDRPENRAQLEDILQCRFMGTRPLPQQQGGAGGGFGQGNLRPGSFRGAGVVGPQSGGGLEGRDWGKTYEAIEERGDSLWEQEQLEMQQQFQQHQQMQIQQQKLQQQQQQQKQLQQRQQQQPPPQQQRQQPFQMPVQQEYAFAQQNSLQFKQQQQQRPQQQQQQQQPRMVRPPFASQKQYEQQQQKQQQRGPGMPFNMKTFPAPAHLSSMTSIPTRPLSQSSSACLPLASSSSIPDSTPLSKKPNSRESAPTPSGSNSYSSRGSSNPCEGSASTQGAANPLVTRITQFLEQSSSPQQQRRLESTSLINFDYLATLTTAQLRQVPKPLLKQLYETLAKMKQLEQQSQEQRKQQQQQQWKQHQQW